MAQRGVMADVMHHAKMEAKHDLEKQGALGASGSRNRLSLFAVLARHP